MEKQILESSNLNSLLDQLNLKLSTNPKGTDKGDYKSYVECFYEKEFECRRNEKNRILEVGVRTGASLALWANFFNDAEIIGLDIEDVGTDTGAVPEYINHPSIKFICNDAYNPSIAKQFTGKFSILIDDGPHSLESQKQFIELYLPKLDDTGVLIIEDIQQNYRDCYKLLKSIPKSSKYIFETYDFRDISKTGDDFLFVIRHNTKKENVTINRFKIGLMNYYSLFLAALSRIKNIF